MFRNTAITTFPELEKFVNVKKIQTNDFYNDTLTTLGVRLITACGLQCFNNFKVTSPLYFDNLTSVDYMAFNSGSTVPVMIIRSNVVPTVGGTPLFGVNFKINAIYVPDALVDSYKSTTGWSAKASIIYPLSECPYELPPKV